jgi:formylglycine-generating enzyme required for sulfatase activity
MKSKILYLTVIVSIISNVGWNWKKEKDSPTNEENSAQGNLVSVEGGIFTADSTPVIISSFTIDKYEVSYELWTEVKNWGLARGYTDLPAGENGCRPVGSNNPVTQVNWYDVVK